jgi:hypothetical protein
MQRPSYRLTPAPQAPLLGKASRALHLSITPVPDCRLLDARFFAGLGVCRIPLPMRVYCRLRKEKQPRMPDARC